MVEVTHSLEDWSAVLDDIQPEPGSRADLPRGERKDIAQGTWAGLSMARAPEAVTKLRHEPKTLTARLPEDKPDKIGQRPLSQDDWNPYQERVHALGEVPVIEGETLEQLGLEKPTPSKGRMQRVREFIEAKRKDFREGMLEDIAEPNPLIIAARRSGELGGKTVMGLAKQATDTYGAIKQMETGPIDPSDVFQPVKQLFGGGATKALGGAETLGVDALGAFSKSGRHITLGPRLKEHVDIKTNFPEADFWIIRKGSIDKIGKPTREFSPEHIGIRSRNHNILPDYLYYAFEAAHGGGHFQQFGQGMLNLNHLRLRDVENLSVGQIMRGRAATHTGGGSEVGVFGSAPKAPKITAVTAYMRGRPEFETLSDEIYNLLTSQRTDMMAAAHKMANELASKDPQLLESLNKLTKGTSHEVIGELAEQIAARQLYEQLFGHSDFELGAFGGRGAGGRIQLEDVEEIAKRLEGVESAGTYHSPHKGTQYYRMRGQDLAGKVEAVVRIPTDEASHPATKGWAYRPGQVLLDTTDAKGGVRFEHATNRGGERYNDVRVLEDALRSMFTRGDRAVPEEKWPRVPGKPVGDQPRKYERGSGHHTKQLPFRTGYRELAPWDDVLEDIQPHAVDPPRR